MNEKLKQKAIELVNHFYHVVYPYVGSSYMTGHEFPEQKFESGKKEALYLVQNILDAMPSNAPDLQDYHELFEIIGSMEHDFHDWENAQTTSKNSV